MGTRTCRQRERRDRQTGIRTDRGGTKTDRRAQRQTGIRAHGQTDGGGGGGAAETVRQTGTKTDRVYTDRHTDKQTNILTDRQTDVHRDRQSVH